MNPESATLESISKVLEKCPALTEYGFGGVSSLPR